MEVSVAGRRAWILGEVSDVEQDQDLLRLLGGFDLFLQGKDRDLIVPDASRHKELWPILGRPELCSMARRLSAPGDLRRPG